MDVRLRKKTTQQAGWMHSVSDFIMVSRVSEAAGSTVGRGSEAIGRAEFG